MTATPNDTNTAPASFLACLPWLWSRRLFPGAPRPTEPMRSRALLWLVLLPAVVLYPCMHFHLFEPDEGRYAQIPFEMLERGDWLVPVLQGEPYLDKPPLFYWLVMLSYSIFGVHAWAARLVCALAVHGCVLLTYGFGCRHVGERSAFWGAWLLALTPGFTGVGRLLLLDGVLAFLTTLALFSAYEALHGPRLRWRWWLLTAVACGLGILCKGPIIEILVLVPLWLHARLMGRRLPLGLRAMLLYLGVVLAIALPWYIAVAVREPAFFEHFFLEHNLRRFLVPSFHVQPVWFYVPILLAGLLPFALLLWPCLRFLTAAKPALAQQRTPVLSLLLLSGLWCVCFFSLSTSKLPTYILPAFPPLLLAAGVFVVATGWAWGRAMRACLIYAYSVLVLGNYLALPWYAESRSPFSQPGEVRAYCGDRRVPVVCYPRNQDSVAFYLGRNDLASYRGKQTGELIQYLRRQPRTVVLFGHRSSVDLLRHHLPAELELTKLTPLGLCAMGVVQRRPIE